jgi:hypothetical protein
MQPVAARPEHEPRTDRPHVGFWAVVTVVPVAVLLIAKADDVTKGIRGLRIDPWLEGQYNFTYEHEFVRRGLIGEIIRRSGYPDGSLALFALSVGIYLILGGLVAWWAWSGFRDFDLRQRMIFTGGCLALPFSLPHFGFDLGRTDTLFYVVALGLLGTTAPVVAFAVVGFLAVLIHELFIVAFVPLLAHGLLRHQRPMAMPRLAALAGGVALAGILVFVAGDLESVPESAYARQLEHEVPGYDGSWNDGNVPAHSMLYKDVGFHLRRSFEAWSPNKVLNVVAAAIPGALLVWWLHRARPGPWLLPALAAAVLPMLVLFVIGVDAPRWVALLSFNVMIVGLLELQGRPLARPELENTRWASWALATTIALGPIGIVNAFPMWETLLDAVT